MIDFAFLADTMLKLLAALPTTLTLFFCSLVLGLTLSLGIVAMRVSRWAILSYPARFYIMIFRGTPLLIQMFLIYYGLGQFPAVRDSFMWVVLKSPYGCAVLSLAMCTAGYTAEIIRGGLLSVPHGQIEAGQAIGMSPWALLYRIIAPVTLRQALPAYSTEAILLVKSTALASLVTVWDVTGVAQQIIQRTYRTMEVFLCAALIYLVLNFLVVRAVAWIEHRLSPHLRERPAGASPKTPKSKTAVTSPTHP
ncbi:MULTISPECIES: ABC transporter permease [unclassified Pseudomonas]|uniref:ABC transporter permease n=1 Tax=unclassified Pseudomonas TaxID=196821 RepID=UPI002AC9E4CA|nr:MULTISPECIES: ABC transporter permease [unclassified Pseudomonas]MEB0043388.1 ABC transporter permease [Pseudomonas sp. MH10]MEB0080096.1 ABC transporter permease [Pseudomonas sp. MH10out]MEB0094034.1 ABC transporter permease [Pseudomonas sp. CCI4.2]MEB0103944.1 ABC transporter permease [Pseudomonas sp. CCI3.2]MEB0123706.1 ABC transporter permease [Pseudomonas sp. CCI1.2]